MGRLNRSLFHVDNLIQVPVELPALIGNSSFILLSRGLTVVRLLPYFHQEG